MVLFLIFKITLHKNIEQALDSGVIANLYLPMKLVKAKANDTQSRKDLRLEG
jgi:hypothetical protein